MNQCLECRKILLNSYRYGNICLDCFKIKEKLRHHRYYKTHKEYFSDYQKVNRKKINMQSTLRRDLKVLVSCVICNKLIIIEQNKRTGTTLYCNDCREKVKPKNQKEYLKEYYIQKKLVYRNRDRERYDKLSWIELINNPFPKDIKIDGHHINNMFIIFLPTITHKHYLGNKREIHREKLLPIIEKIYNISLKGLLTGNW